MSATLPTYCHQGFTAGQGSDLDRQAICQMLLGESALREPIISVA